MINKIKQSNILYTVVFFCFISFLGLSADNNLYRSKFYNESSANYDVGNVEDDIQSLYSVNFPFKVQLIDCNATMKNIIGQREMNNVTKLNNGYLTEVDPALSDECISDNVQEIIKYNEYCKQQGITLLYVSPAYKISKFDNQLPAGVVDGHNETVDKLLSKLAAEDINVLDLRQCMYDGGLNQYDYYYRTDHHWTTEGAFYAYQQISTWISEQTGTYLDKSLLDINNYQIDTYKEWHLGARGQRTGSAFAGIDDFDLIYPKYDATIYNKETHTTYPLKDALVNMDTFNTRNILKNHVYDEAYWLHEINDLECVNAPSQLNVLLIGDSFSFALNPYMLATYSNYHRSQTYTVSSLKTSDIANYNPDVVIILKWPGYFDSNRVHFEFIDDAEE